MVEHFSEAAGGGAAVMQLGGSSGRRLKIGDVKIGG